MNNNHKCWYCNIELGTDVMYQILAINYQNNVINSSGLIESYQCQTELKKFQNKYQYDNSIKEIKISDAICPYCLNYVE